MPVPALVAARPSRTTSISSTLLPKLAVNAVVLLLAALVLVAQPARPAGQAHSSGRAPVVGAEVRTVAAVTTRVRSALRIARGQKGDPYRYGAAGPNAFDCSGLIYYSTHRAGFRKVPRTSSAQSHFMRRIKRSSMRPGDFVFFYNGGGVYHVGVFTGWSHGRRLIVHAPYSGTRVRTERIWTNRWFPGTLRGR